MKIFITERLTTFSINFECIYEHNITSENQYLSRINIHMSG